MTNLIIILTLSFSLLFGVDTPKEIDTQSQITNKVPFDLEILKQGQSIKKRLKKMQTRQAQRAKSVPKPAGNPIYLSNQKRDKTLLKATSSEMNQIKSTRLELQNKERQNKYLNISEEISNNQIKSTRLEQIQRTVSGSSFSSERNQIKSTRLELQNKYRNIFEEISIIKAIETPGIQLN